MRTFLFGANSMLGWSIFRSAGLPNVTPFCNGFTRGLDGIERGIHLDDRLAVYQLFEEEQPELIVHCAGVCDVEKCEDSPEFAYSVNVDGMQILVDHAPPTARIVYCSSEHVFGGDRGPYREDSPTHPISVYGRTRVAAEQLLLAARPDALIIRGGLWIGPSASGRNGHLDWLRYRHKRQMPMTVIAEEVRTAVWADDAARRVGELARSQITGIRHLTSTHAIARPALARYLNERFAIGADFRIGHRSDVRAPHLGNVELATMYTDPLATPLPAVVPLDAVRGAA